MKSYEKHGSGLFGEECEYVVRRTYSGADVVRGDGSYTRLPSVEAAERLAERLAAGEESDDGFTWID